MKHERLHALTDGIFAIAMTLLVLDLKLPELARDVTAPVLTHELLSLWPVFFSFTLSFALLYGYWRAQTLRRYPELAKPRHFVPPAALVVGTALAFTPLRPLLALGACLFAGAVVKLRAPGEAAPITAASCLFFPSWFPSTTKRVTCPNSSGASPRS